MDSDHDSIAFNATDRALTHRIVHGVCDAAVEGWTGRKLHGGLSRAGFRKVVVEAVPLATADHRTYGWYGPIFADMALTAGAITTEEATAWTQDLEDLARHGQWFFVWNVFIASASRPH
jgi:hypothetical protein